MLSSKYLPPRLRSQLSRRELPVEVASSTSSHPYFELRRILGKRFPALRVSDHDFYGRFDRIVADMLVPGDSLYAYEDAAQHALRRARALGVPSVYELPMGFHRMATEVLSQECDLNPRWSATIPGLQLATQVSERKDEELGLAELVVVPSTFAASTVPELYRHKARTVVYGGPETAPVNEVSVRAGGTSLKALYVGGLTQRKGLSYMFEGISKSDVLVELTVVGRRFGDCPALDAELAKVNYFESMPHAELLRLMRQSDVLLFPTLFDGYGLVIAEAMSQGCPVIATTSCAGPDLIESGKNGLLVSPGDADAIAGALEMLAMDQDLNNSMKVSALKATRSWGAYRDDLVAEIRRN